MVVGAVSAGGLTVVIARVRGKYSFKKSSQNLNPKEEVWER